MLSGAPCADDNTLLMKGHFDSYAKMMLADCRVEPLHVAECPTCACHDRYAWQYVKKQKAESDLLGCLPMRC